MNTYGYTQWLGGCCHDVSYVEANDKKLNRSLRVTGFIAFPQRVLVDWEFF